MKCREFEAAWAVFREGLLKRITDHPLYKNHTIWEDTGDGGLRRTRNLQVLHPTEYGRRDSVLQFCANCINWDGKVDWDRIDVILESDAGSFYYDEQSALYWALDDLSSVKYAVTTSFNTTGYGSIP